MNIPSAPAELKSQILYSSDRNITYNLRNTTKTALYLPKTNNPFFNLFVEKICIKHIQMLFIDFKKHILLNIKSYCKFALEIFEKFDVSYKKVCFINYKKKEK